MYFFWKYQIKVVLLHKISIIMKKRILGLDTGTNSLGWAVVDKLDDNSYQLVRRGVLLFQEGVKIEKGIESSKASERTAHRSLRKQYFRRRLRKIRVLEVLVKNNLCPYLSPESLHEWHVHKKYPKVDEFMLWQRTNDNEGKNPYYYRHLCLTEKLDMDCIGDRYVLGRAMYHLAQRRGFLSNRLDSSQDDKESGAVKTGITELSKEMEAAGYEYLGEYFYHLYAEQGNTVRIRTRYTDREQHYLKEFDAICEKQEIGSELKKELEKALYFQRPLKSQRHGVGKCTFEPHKPRCAESHPAYEEFRMLSFLNIIKVKGPYDVDLRPLSSEEKEKIEPLFYRKALVKSSHFDFEDIAKTIAGRNKYSHIKDADDKPYKFNFRMTQGVAGCPFTAQMRGIFGDDWKSAIAESYTLMQKQDGIKTIDEAVNDIWNVLYSFSSEEKLKEFAIDKLQLDEEKAEKFSKVKMNSGFAAISLNAINKILPFLREGYIYSHAVSLANIPAIVSKAVWNNAEQRSFILQNLNRLIENFDPKDKTLEGTLDFCIKDFLMNNFELAAGAADKLYHPSMIETYQDAKPNKQGVYQLGSPRVSAIRNPMAMRSLHELRKVVNQLLKEGVIDNTTEVHVEYARELNDANKRKAIADYQRALDNNRKKYQDEILQFYQEQGSAQQPTDDDILKFQLWEEQDHVCLYTGDQIGMADFLGKNPLYDIEHTVPRSVGGDSTKENLTLCQRRFNRETKKGQLPSQLANHEEILVRLAGWKEKVEKLSKDIDKIHTFSGMAKDMKDRLIQRRHRLIMERDYWRGKYNRFTMTEVPEGFSRRQGAGIGLVSKYAGLYLKSLFHNPKDRNKSNVFVVKGATTAEFRKMWGLQSDYEKKSRDNHVHHCIDAITIACIGKYDSNLMSRYYHDVEAFEAGVGKKPQFPKPWPTFTEDVLNIQNELLVVGDMPDNMPKKARRRIRLENPARVVVAQGDSARGSLHNDTYYGAIERDGDIRYVVRRPLSSFDKASDLESIVDEAVKQTIKDAVAGRNFKEAIAEGIWMNKQKGIRINKVRCYADSVKNPLKIRQQRDVSKKEYKQQFNVMNDSNYLMAIYEGEEKGRKKFAVEVINMLDAAKYYKKSADRDVYSSIVPIDKNGFPLKVCLRVGLHVLLYDESVEEIDFGNKRDLKSRLYKIVGLNAPSEAYPYGKIVLRHHQEARQSKELKAKNGVFKMGEDYRASIALLHTQFKGLVEGQDFDINVLGEIILK